MTNEGKRYVELAAVLKDLDADAPHYDEVLDEMDQIWWHLGKLERAEINGLLISIDEVERMKKRSKLDAQVMVALDAIEAEDPRASILLEPILKAVREHGFREGERDYKARAIAVAAGTDVIPGTSAESVGLNGSKTSNH